MRLVRTIDAKATLNAPIEGTTGINCLLNCFIKSRLSFSYRKLSNCENEDCSEILRLCFQALGAGKFDELGSEPPDDEEIDLVNDETFGAGAECKTLTLMTKQICKSILS